MRRRRHFKQAQECPGKIFWNSEKEAHCTDLFPQVTQVSEIAVLTHRLDRGVVKIKGRNGLIEILNKTMMFPNEVFLCLANLL